MAHFAQMNNNTVSQVIVVNNEMLDNKEFPESEPLGIAFCKSLFGEDSEWLQTSYNGNFRYNYAGIGFTYDSTDDAFILPMPGCGHNELTLNELKRWECTNEEHNFVF